MEIKIYLSPTDYAKHKCAFCRKVEHRDVFQFNSALDVFKSVFGVECVIEFVVL